MLGAKSFPNVTKRTVFHFPSWLLQTFILHWISMRMWSKNFRPEFLGVKLARGSLLSMLFQMSWLGQVLNPSSTADSDCSSEL